MLKNLSKKQYIKLIGNKLFLFEGSIIKKKIKQKTPESIENIDELKKYDCYSVINSMKEPKTLDNLKYIINYKKIEK